MADGMTQDPIITADDVVRAGACHSGVAAVVRRHHGRIAAAMPVSAVTRLIKYDQRLYVLKAAELDGDGDGSGYGYSYGHGSGYGDGDGHGSGYGDGDGDGSGDGYGSGYGYVSGSGDGSGEY